MAIFHHILAKFLLLLASAASTTTQLFPLLSKLLSQWMMKLGMDKQKILLAMPTRAVQGLVRDLWHWRKTRNLITKVDFVKSSSLWLLSQHRQSLHIFFKMVWDKIYFILFWFPCIAHRNLGKQGFPTQSYAFLLFVLCNINIEHLENTLLFQLTV